MINSILENAEAMLTQFDVLPRFQPAANEQNHNHPHAVQWRWATYIAFDECSRFPIRPWSWRTAAILRTTTREVHQWPWDEIKTDWQSRLLNSGLHKLYHYAMSISFVLTKPRSYEINCSLFSTNARNSAVGVYQTISHYQRRFITTCWLQARAEGDRRREQGVGGGGCKQDVIPPVKAVTKLL
jgi:hypothetical protein